jgi:hypothetical protein
MKGRGGASPLNRNRFLGDFEMGNALRIFAVGLLVTSMSIPPAAAWHCCGSYEPVYYEPVHDGCCGEVVVHDDCGCGPCDGCGECSGETTEAAPSEATEEPVPTPPEEAPPEPVPQAPVETPEAPVETPPAEEPAEDSLFNGSEETPPPSEEPMPPAEEPTELFEEPAETPAPVETPPAEEPAEDDLFGEPTDTETPAEEPAEQPAEETPAEETPAEDTPAEEPAEETDDIFGRARGVTSEPGGLASEEMRLWVDNTGNFSCHGRIISLQDTYVRLLKDNGRTATVPLRRLSASDLEFVNRQANARQGEEFQTASR